MTAEVRAVGVVSPGIPPEIYIQEQDYWPWGELLQAVTNHIAAAAPYGARVVDVMCGPGPLLGRLHAVRPDLRLEGYDANPEYIAYAAKHFPGISFECRDATLLTLPRAAEMLVCTGGLHHLPFDGQRPFLKHLASLISPGGSFVLGEEVLSPYGDDVERRLAAVQLGAALLTAAIRRDAPVALLDAAIEVMVCDLFIDGEYKLDIARLRSAVETAFDVEQCQHVWPGRDAVYGDYVFVCRPRTDDDPSL